VEKPSDNSFLISSLRLRPAVRLRRFICASLEAIFLAYEAPNQPSPLAIRIHSTKSMAASKTSISGVSLQDGCDVVGWTFLLTFIRFYDLNLGLQVLMSYMCVLSIHNAGTCKYGIWALMFPKRLDPGV